MTGEQIRIGVARAPNRCPYCHDEVRFESEPWLACASCLARHHDECWRTAGRCGTCGCRQPAGALAVAQSPPPPPVSMPVAASPPSKGGLLGDILVFVGFVAAFGLLGTVVLAPIGLGVLVLTAIVAWLRVRRG